MKARGTNTTTVVMVDAKIAGPTSLVASKRSPPTLPTPLNVAIYVLQHHDGVVHDPAH